MAVKRPSVTWHAALVTERGQSRPAGDGRGWEEDCFCLFSSNAMQRQVRQSLQSKTCLSFPVEVIQLTLSSPRAAVKPLVPSQDNEIMLGELLGGLKHPGHAWPGSAQPQHFPPKEETQGRTRWLCGSEWLPRDCIFLCCGCEVFAAGILPMLSFALMGFLPSLMLCIVSNKPWPRHGLAASPFSLQAFPREGRGGGTAWK